MTDAQLLQQFVRENSQSAFSQLVRRHKDWLYSACLRRLRDPALAEDAVQTVFQVLSRKAAKLLDAPTLSPWLHQAAKYASQSLRRSQLRRTHHEREAAAMSPTQISDPNDAHWTQIEPDLEPALDRLGERDRQVILMRFYEQQSHSQIAATLNISEESSQKRLSRALDRLRTLLNRTGTTPPAAAIGGMLLTHAVGPAPVSLATACSALASTLPPRALAVSKAIGHATTLAKIKTAVAAVALLAIPATAVATHYYFARSAPSPQTQTFADITPPVVPALPVANAPATAPAATQPAIDLSTPEKTFVSVIAALRSGDRDQLYRCLLADPKREPLLIDRVLDRNIAINRMTAAAEKVYGPGAGSQLSPDMTIDSVMEMMAATGPGKHVVTNDTAQLSAEVSPVILAMLPPNLRELGQQWSDAPIWFKKQSGDWKLDIDQSMRVVIHTELINGNREQEAQRDSVVLQEMTDATDQLADEITAGQFATLPEAVNALKDSQKLVLIDNGLNGIDMMIVPAKATVVSTIDHGKWSFYSESPSVFTAEMDPNTLRNGHATLRIASDSAIRSQTAHYQRKDRSPQQYLGHRIRVTAWMKSEQIVDDAGIRIRVLDADGSVIADEGQRKRRPISGTTDWKKYTAFADVPENTAAIQWGFILNEKGNLWIDLDSAKLEIAPAQ